MFKVFERLVAKADRGKLFMLICKGIAIKKSLNQARRVLDLTLIEEYIEDHLDKLEVELSELRDFNHPVETDSDKSDKKFRDMIEKILFTCAAVAGGGLTNKYYQKEENLEEETLELAGLSIFSEIFANKKDRNQRIRVLGRRSQTEGSEARRK